jgi:hypothetical protein
MRYHHNSPCELYGPVAYNAPNEGASIEVGRHYTGQGRGERDVGEECH